MVNRLRWVLPVALALWAGSGRAATGRSEAQRTGQVLPSLHSSLFAPERGATLRTAVTTLAVSALELLGAP